MTTLLFSLDAVAALVPAAVGAFLLRRLPGPASRAWAVAAASVSLAATTALLVVWYASGASSDVAFAGPTWLGHASLRIDELSAVVLPFAALVVWAVVVMMPRAWATPARLARLLFGGAVVVAIFSTDHPALLAVLWALAVLPAGFDLAARSVTRPTARVFLAYMTVSVVAFAAGAALLLAAPHTAAPAALGLVLVGVMVRKGVVPLHSWFPEVFARGSLGGVLGLAMPHVGAYAVVRLVVPNAAGAEPLELALLSLAALVTAVWGAALGLVQPEPRRALGYLTLSQSALVLAGLTGTTPVSLVGGLTMWLSSGLALTGLGLTIWALEARTGPLALTTFSGNYRDTPLLAAFFVLFGLASVGLPGTLGFVSTDLLVTGALGADARVGVLLIVATALNGIAVLRAFFLLFGGPPSGGPQRDLVPRERLVLTVLLALLVVTGLAPGPLVRSRANAAATLSRVAPATESAPTVAAPRHPVPPEPR